MAESDGNPAPAEQLEQIVRAAHSAEQSACGHFVRRVAARAQLGEEPVVVEVSGHTAQPQRDANEVVGSEALELGGDEGCRRREAVGGDKIEHESGTKVQNTDCDTAE